LIQFTDYFFTGSLLYYVGTIPVTMALNVLLQASL
jgi:uncharacterized membrane protein